MFWRALLLISVVALPIASVIGAMQAEPLHSLMEKSALALQSYGPKHPQVIELNKEIDRRLKSGERIDAEAIEKRLIELVTQRGELRRRYGARHPKTIDNAKRIHGVAGMLISAE